MTAELVLLLAVYGMFILGLFVDPQHGAVSNFKDNLPKLSARIEKHTATGLGFWSTRSEQIRWAKPPQ